MCRTVSRKKIESAACTRYTQKPSAKKLHCHRQNRYRKKLFLKNVTHPGSIPTSINVKEFALDFNYCQNKVEVRGTLSIDYCTFCNKKIDGIYQQGPPKRNWVTKNDNRW